MNKPFYTGIGARITPPAIMSVMSRMAKVLESEFILRSGRAVGGDTAFESGVVSSLNKVIYLPSAQYKGGGLPRSHGDREYPSYDSYLVAQEHHPNWGNLSTFVKCLMARNAHQVLGDNLDTPSRFLICWTADGCTSDITRAASTGGTGLAISIACAHGVPVYNLKNYEDSLYIDMSDEALISFIETEITHSALA